MMNTPSTLPTSSPAAPSVSKTVLRRAAELDPLAWTLQYRRIGAAPFRLPPPLIDLYRDRAPAIVVAKAAQVMISEWAVNLAFWCAETGAGGRGNVLYVFPAAQQLGDFVRARVDKAIADSPYLQLRLNPADGAGELDNVGLKRLGRGFLYFRGSSSEAGLLTVDADLVVFDEVDRLKPGTLSLADKRLGSSLLGWQRFISTPTYPEIGIDALWLKSDRRRYHLRCDACTTWQALEFPNNVIEDGTVICSACRAPLDRLKAGEWVAERPSADMHGYNMTKLLSPRADIAALAKLGYRILRREETDPSAIQQFWNQDIGIAHAPEGGQLARADIEACIADYSLDQWRPTGCTMGVDVGSRLHVRINAPSPTSAGKSRAAFIGNVPGFDDLDRLMNQFDVSACVVDAAPEGHAARAFRDRFQGRVWLCHYPNTANWPHKEPKVFNRDERTVAAHRTLTMDAAFARIRERRIEYPREVLSVPEFVEHMTAPVRVIEKDNAGNFVARYVESGRPDHLAHAENYALIAEAGRPQRVGITALGNFTPKPGKGGIEVW
jgi:phage terminase large subunit GpA